MFSAEVTEFVQAQNYKRSGPVTEEEFSQVAFRLYGTFFVQDLSLENIVNVCNCALLARAEA